MTTTTSLDDAAALGKPSGAPPSSERRHGSLGRLGRWTATHGRAVGLAWLVVIALLGLVAPKVETALSGAGWQADGSQSVQVRALAQTEFGGAASSALQVVVHSEQPVTTPTVRDVLARVE